ncbi:MAG: HAMP domain-containing sensor histidine kinase [Methylotetracoccus sp.]
MSDALRDAIASFAQPGAPASHGAASVALIEQWAAQKEYELKHRLLKDLLMRYACLERELAELNGRLLAANQLKNRFVGFAAHDLRSPLSSIRGLSEVLLEEVVGPLNADQRELIATIFAASRDTLALVNDLLDISVIDSGHLELRMRPEALDSLLTERLRIASATAGLKGIRLSSRFDAIPPVPCDRNRIAQVIDNLLGNAVKFSPRDATIDIHLQRQERYARISVTDQGPGIPAGEHALVFGEFHTSSVQPTDTQKGTGLGLAIVKRIVEAHGGEVAVSSAAGAGATFRFSIPISD